MHTLLDDYITGMGYVGIEPGVLYHLAPVTRGVETVLSGTGLVVLEDVIGDWVGLSLHGRSEQATTTGAQLFDYSTILSKQITAGVVHIDADGRIILDGKFGAGSREFRITLLPGTYTLSADDPEKWHILAPADSLFNQTLQVDEITTYECYIASGTYDRIATTPMINQGSKALPWEPYTGGRASPNSDYPQEIKNAGEKTAQLWSGGNFECTSGGSSSGFMYAPQSVTDVIKDLPDGIYTISYTPHGEGAIGTQAGKVSIYNAENKALLYQINTFEMTEDLRAGIASVALYGYINSINKIDDFMLNAGSAALHWEPYGYKIETTLDNAGYLERGSASENVKKIALRKGRKYKLYSTSQARNKNAFVFSDGNLSFANGNEIYSYGVNKGYNTNNVSGIVSGECKLDTKWDPAIEFEVKENGLYLYYALNSSGLSENDIWVWTGEGYLTDTPYQSQTITSYLPSGLPGIPVSSGGDYTDETGQQWVTDEIDFRRGKYVQRVWKGTLDGSEQWFLYGAYGSVFSGFISGNVLPEIMSKREGFCNQFKVSSVDHIYTEEMWLGLNSYSVACVSNPFRDSTAEDSGLSNWKAHLAQNPMEVMTYLETPIETDLSAEEIESYKALRTYKPATIITADGGGEVKPGITATCKKGE